MSTFDHLVQTRLAGVEASARFFAQQAREQNPRLFLNTQMWLREAFELALLHWARLDWDEARRWFGECVRIQTLRTEQLQLLHHVPDARAAAIQDGQSPRLARIAGYLTDAPAPVPTDQFAQDERPGYAPWFDRVFLDACTEGVAIDPAAFEASKQRALIYRQGATGIAGWDFYREVLEERWSSRAPQEMLATHDKLFRQRAKRRGLGNVIDGDGKYNELVPDFIFAIILKKIGWSRAYRHAWPATTTSA